MTAAESGDLFEAIPEAEVAASLLPYLRDSTATPRLSFAEPPKRILGGYDTLIYAFELARASGAFSGPLILRVFRDERGPERVRFETTVQNAIADLDYPTPRVLLTCLERAVLGGAFCIMPPLPGRVMVDGFLRPGFHRLPGLLAQLQARLHALDPEPLRRELTVAGFDPGELCARADLGRMREKIEAASLTGLEAGARWLAEHMPAPARTRICHGDFHPLNVLMHGGAVSGVLDWSRVSIDDPAYDIGGSVALMTEAPVHLPAFLGPVLRAVRRWLARRYIEAYRAVLPLDSDAVSYYEAFRCLGFLLEAGEKQQSAAGVIAPVAKPTAFGEPRVIAAVSARFGEITGETLALPR